MRRTRPARILAALALAFLGGCASGDPKTASGDVYDPYEGFNRDVYGFNRTVDDYFLRPVAVFYRDAFPEPLRNGVHNVLNNLGEPVIVGNDLLQGEGTRAAQQTGRFLINSTIGVGGTFDVATKANLPEDSGDFGQTLAVWGVGEGPFLMLPVIGPSNPRDAVGFGVDGYADPFSHWWSNIHQDGYNYARFGVTAADQRSRVIDDYDELKRTSLDEYATIRSVFVQRRRGIVSRGETGSAIPDYDDPASAAPQGPSTKKTPQ